MPEYGDEEEEARGPEHDHERPVTQALGVGVDRLRIDRGVSDYVGDHVEDHELARERHDDFSADGGCREHDRSFRPTVIIYEQLMQYKANQYETKVSIKGTRIPGVAIVNHLMFHLAIINLYP
jgi:hypothetical protein